MVVDLIPAFIDSFIQLFVIVDIFGTLPVFLALTKTFKKGDKEKALNSAVMVAGTLMAIVLIAGGQILSFLGVTLPNFRIAGGIILGLLGIEIVLGHYTDDDDKKGPKDYNAAAAIIGTPLITGPGVISSIIILTGQYGIAIVAAAIAANLIISWLVLKSGEHVQRLLGNQTILIFSKVMGLILLAIAVSFIRIGFGV